MKRLLSTLVPAIAAGLCIGLGGTVFLALMEVNRLLGAVLFTVGLFTICTQGFALYTGKVCYLPDNPPGYLLSVAAVWLGNLIGTAAVGSLLRLTRIGPACAAAAESLCAVKTADSALSLFLLGVLCNIFIYIAVEGYRSNPHETGKYLAMVLGVAGFILAGTEHSVADMFYFAAAGQLATAAAVRCLVIITLGNLCGGVLLPLLKRLYGR